MTYVSFLSAILTGAAVALMARMLLRYHRQLRPICRFGIGIMGAALMLTLAEYMYPGSPFEDWSFVLLRIGIVCVFFEFGCAVCRGRKEAAKGEGLPKPD